MTCIAAIDPGLTGAIAFFFPQAPERVSVFDMPVVGSEVEFASLARLLRQHGPAAAWVEQVGPMPTDGAVQAFKFGGAYQAAKVTVGMCDVPMHLVTPQVWKKALRIGGGKEGKEQARALALRLFPASAEHFARVKDHGRAEAALLARYGADILKMSKVAA
jgi:hypothetical protein